MQSARRIFNVRPQNFRGISDFVKIVEVGPRDGLQNEKKMLPTASKIDLVNRLSETGLSAIEITNFVSPKLYPQMRDNAEVFRGIIKKPEINYSVLVPNLKGLEGALAVGAKAVAVVVSPSETASRKNANCSIEESVKRCASTIKMSRENNIKVRGYVSCIAGCPYEGQIEPSIIAKYSSILLELGCYEISLVDIIGVGTPKKIDILLKEVKHASATGDMSEFAMHCHDTFGQGLANVYTSLENDVRVFDSSVAGLGGCPYAAGASGNVATEDLLYLFNGQGLSTGVNVNKIVETGDWLCKELRTENKSKAGVAMLSQRKPEKSSN